jgi:hypothetical protein
VRLATRQAVREALDDVLDEQSEPAKGTALVGTATAVNDDDAGDATSGGDIPGDVEEEPGSQAAG